MASSISPLKHSSAKCRQSVVLPCCSKPLLRRCRPPGNCRCNRSRPDKENKGRRRAFLGQLHSPFDHSRHRSHGRGKCNRFSLEAVSKFVSGLQLVKQRLRLFQIARVEPFGKPVVDGRESSEQLQSLAQLRDRLVSRATALRQQGSASPRWR